MMVLSYREPNLAFGQARPNASRQQIQDLQRDLRRLGYLKAGIDGVFGGGTDLAVRRLRYDLLRNDGKSAADDGDAAVRVMDYNRGRVTTVSGTVDSALADCIADMLGDSAYPELPASDNPAQANRQVVERLRMLAPTRVPMPFLLGIFKQESGLKHFREPSGADVDSFIVVGLDTNAGSDEIVTSRGFGMGQYTLFHHPPRHEEVSAFILDPAQNVMRAVQELQEKFDHFVIGPTAATRADDRIAEVGNTPLRPCKYKPDDGRYMRDCVACLHGAGTVRIEAEKTPLWPGSSEKYTPTTYYKDASYAAVPDRRKLECDWPYAVRRYNGSGVNSFHYQSRVLTHVLSI